MIERLLWRCALALVVGYVLATLLTTPAPARDLDGRYAGSPLKSWFDSLTNANKQPCCSDADGNVVKDSDWDSVNDPDKPKTHYKVRLPIEGTNDGEWIDVPDEAVIKQPNLYGRTVVWPLKGYLGTTIRCFIPGPMT